MSKERATIVVSVFVLVAAVLMGVMYTYNNTEISYSMSDTSLVDDIKINNITTISGIDTLRLDGPNIEGHDINVDLDLLPNETYKFSFDLVNKTKLKYKMNRVRINCLNDVDVNNNLTVSMKYEDGTLVRDGDFLESGTMRKVIVTISYDKNPTEMKNFILDFDMDINPSAIR